MKRNFVATVKEGPAGPWVLLEIHEDIGLGSTQVTLRLRAGAELDAAQEVARFLNDRVEAIRLLK